MAIPDVEFSREGCFKNIDKNWSSGKLSKIGHNFRKLSDLQLMLSKNVLLNSYSSMKKNQKDSDDF